MKKVGAILVVILVLALAGLPPVLGMFTEGQVNARVASLQSNPFVFARVISFERGWFSSTSRIELGVAERYRVQLDALADDPVGPRTATILVDFAHGPLALGDGVYLGLSRMVARPDPQAPGYTQLLEQLGVPYLFEFRGRTAFSGTTRFDADVPPVNLTADGGDVRFSGAEIDGAAAGRAIRYNGRIESLAFTSGSGAFALQGLTVEGDNEMLANVPLGPAEVVIARVSMSDAAVAGGPVFDAANVRMRSEFALDASGTLVNGEQTFAADSIDAPPGMAVREAVLTFAYRNLDADALEAYTAAMQRSVAAGVVDRNQFLAELTPAVERLLTAQPSLAIDPARFTLNDGAFDARLTIGTRPGALPPAGALDLRDPTLWLALLDMTADLTVAKNLARDLAIRVMSAQFAASDPAMPPDQIRYMAEAQAGLVFVTLIGQNFLVDDGERYSTRLAFTNGTLSVNGAPFPIGLP